MKGGFGGTPRFRSRPHERPESALSGSSCSRAAAPDYAPKAVIGRLPADQELRVKLLRHDGAGVWEGRKSEALELRLVGKCKQPTRCPDSVHRAMQRDLSALKRGHKSDIAEPHLGEGIKISGDHFLPCRSARRRALPVKNSNSQPLSSSSHSTHHWPGIAASS